LILRLFGDTFSVYIVHDVEVDGQNERRVDYREGGNYCWLSRTILSFGWGDKTILDTIAVFSQLTKFRNGHP